MPHRKPCIWVSELSDKGRCLEGTMKALVDNEVSRSGGSCVCLCSVHPHIQAASESQERSSWTAVKVSSGPGRVLPPLGLLEAAGLAGESGAHNSLAAFNVPWT